MQNIKHIHLQIMPPSMTESLGASKRRTGSLELYDRNTCYTLYDGRQVMAKAKPSMTES
jgi:hypothetical protein